MAPAPSAASSKPSPISTISASDRRKAAHDHGRNLVLCFDGTANEYTDTNTNIVKLFTFLEKEAPEQLCYYQTGVGTYIRAGYTNPVTKWIAKTADLGVAWFLDEHVMGGYRYLQNTYEAGDRIYLFGFSRGAYTARALAGMLYTVGLLPKNMPEQVPFAYEIFKKGKESTSYKRAFSRSVSIEFIGVFDTVSSVGAIFPRVLPFSSNNHITRNYRHAMALDEHRAKFRSNPWHLTVNPDIEDEFSRPTTGVVRTTIDEMKEHQHEHQERRKPTKDELSRDREQLDAEEGLDRRSPTDVKEVWFAGCHCDIGGGNDPDSSTHSLANVTLKWMIKEIIACNTGLIFRREALERAHLDLDELVQAAERTKIEDARHRKKVEATQPQKSSNSGETSESANATLNSPPPLSPTEVDEIDNEATLKVSSHPGGIVHSVRDSDDGRLASKQIENQTLYERWKGSDKSGAEDALCGITDELKKAPAWWLLEFLPFVDSNQDEHGHWVNSLRINLFRPRSIPRPPAHTNPNSYMNSSTRGVSITDAPALFHISVKHRMEQYQPKPSFWSRLLGKGNMGEKEKYRPRAWPPAGEPVWVE